MVEHVEEFRPELGPQPFMDGRALGQRHIQLREPRTGERVAADVTECARVGRTEGSRIEPLLHGLSVERATKSGRAVGPHRVAGVPVSRRIVAQLRREGETALQGRNPAERPSIYQLLGCRVSRQARG